MRRAKRARSRPLWPLAESSVLYLWKRSSFAKRACQRKSARPSPRPNQRLGLFVQTVVRPLTTGWWIARTAKSSLSNSRGKWPDQRPKRKDFKMGSELSNDDVLRLLRELQGQAIPQDEVMPFEDWRQSGGPARDLSKSRGHFSAGTGMLGTSSFAPAGPASRPSGNQMTGLKGRPSLDLEPWFGNQQFGVQPSSRGSQPSQYLTQRQDQRSEEHT